jgi:N-methylhydantoinase A
MNAGNLHTRDIYIGVDVGGTHTDVCAISGDRIERGKAFTTYDDFSCVFR